ncbi:MAG: pelota family protein [Acidilobus sp.]
MEVKVLDSKKRTIEVLPRSEEDLWTLALTLRKGDRLRLVVLRDVAGREAKEKQRRPIEVTLRLESVEFQPFSGALRVFGVIEEGPDRFGVKGRHQSAYIGLNEPIIMVREEGWSDRVLRKLIESGPRGRAIIASIDYDELAIGVLTSEGIRIVEDRGLSLGPKDDPSRERRLEEVISEAAQTVVRLASEQRASVVLSVGPGQLKEDLAAKVRGLAPSLTVITDSASSGGVEGIYEALRRDSTVKALREVESVEAQVILEEFLARVSRDPATVAYTVDDVLQAAEMGAVEKAVIIDEFLYSDDDEVREKFTKLVELVESKGGRVVIITRESPASQTVSNMGGVIALLRYRLELGRSR